MRRLALILALLSPAALADRVEPRLFVKERRFFFSGGVTWLERGDYYNNPGFLASVAWYVRENDAIEARGVLFASWLGSSADEVFQSTGLVPDAHKPAALLATGWRHSIAYGKVTTGESILHFDFQGGADVGLFVTDRSSAPALIAFFGLIARFGDHFFGQLDLSLIGSHESRSAPTFTTGFLPMLTLGGAL